MKFINRICINIIFISGLSFADRWGFPREFSGPMYWSNTNNNQSRYPSENFRRQSLPQNPDQYSEPSPSTASPPRSPTFDQSYPPPPLPLSNPPMRYPPPLPNGLTAPSFNDIGFYPVGPPFPLFPPPPFRPPMFLEPLPYGHGSNSKPEYREDFLFPMLLGAGIKTGIASVVGPLAVLGIVGKLIGKGALGVGGASLLGGVAGSSPLSAITSSASMGKRRRRRSLSAIVPEPRFIYPHSHHGEGQEEEEGSEALPLPPVRAPVVVPASTSRRLRAMEVASRYLSELGLQERAILDDLGLTYMGCAGLLDKNNHCLERLACELYSHRGRKPDDASPAEKEVASLILENVLENQKLDRSVKNRVRRAAKLGQEQRKMCFIFNCEHLRPHYY